MVGLFGMDYRMLYPHARGKLLELSEIYHLKTMRYRILTTSRFLYFNLWIIKISFINTNAFVKNKSFVSFIVMVYVIMKIQKQILVFLHLLSKIFLPIVALFYLRDDIVFRTTVYPVITNYRLKIFENILFQKSSLDLNVKPIHLILGCSCRITGTILTFQFSVPKFLIVNLESPPSTSARGCLPRTVHRPNPRNTTCHPCRYTRHTVRHSRTAYTAPERLPAAFPR